MPLPLVAVLCFHGWNRPASILVIVPMRKLWKRLLFGFGLFCLLAALSAIGFFKLVEHRITQRLEPPELHRIEPPQPAPELVFTTLDGQQRSLASLRGKAVFLDLWGTWCIQCIAEMPTIQKLYDRFRNDPEVVFVIASRLDSPNAVRAYARRHHLDLPFYVIDDSAIPSSMQLGQYPETFLISKEGDLVAQHTGAADWSSTSAVNILKGLARRTR